VRISTLQLQSEFEAAAPGAGAGAVGVGHAGGGLRDLTASNLVNAACQVRKCPMQELKQSVSGMREEVCGI